LHEVIFITVEVFARDILLYFFSLSAPAEVVEGIGIVIFLLAPDALGVWS